MKNLGISGDFLKALEIYVGVLAATILFIATNAGVIGASRITYAMASYRQLPVLFRRLHPRFLTPWIAIVFFAGLVPILTIARARRPSSGRSTPSARPCPSPSRTRQSSPSAPAGETRSSSSARARTSAGVGSTGRSSPSSAASAPGSPGSSSSSRTPATRWAGLGWLVLGLAFYFVYRRRFVREPLKATVRAPALVLGPSLELLYRTILVPVVRNAESEEALVAAARLAADRRATIATVHVLEVPPRASDRCAAPRARGRGERPARGCARLRRGLRRSRRHEARPRPPGRPGDRGRGREPPGRAARHRRQARLARGRTPIFGRTVDHVLRKARAASCSRRRARRHDSRAPPEAHRRPVRADGRARDRAARRNGVARWWDVRLRPAGCPFQCRCPCPLRLQARCGVLGAPMLSSRNATCVWPRLSAHRSVVQHHRKGH